jgi:hypothetical protein
MSEGNRIHDIIGELLCNDGMLPCWGDTPYNWLWCLTLLGSFLRQDRCSCVCSTFVSTGSTCDMN